LTNNKKRKKPVGRPPATVPAVFDSMAACAGFFDIPVRRLREAKSAGCDAFSSNRVDVRKFLAWVCSADEKGSDWSERLTAARAQREEIRLDKDQGETISKPVVAAMVQKALGTLFGSLDRVFCYEFPPAVKGKSEAEIHKKAMASIESMKDALREEWKEVLTTP
jgi:hypothetical protein